MQISHRDKEIDLLVHTSIDIPTQVCSHQGTLAISLCIMCSVIGTGVSLYAKNRVPITKLAKMLCHNLIW